jgi:DNA polymerase I-like protein with 3'-5' exonuclease and polymerase domains
MNRGCAQLISKNYCLRLQMHDEIVVEVPDNQEAVNQAIEDIKNAFEVTLNGVKFIMGISTGSSWSCGKE